MDTSPKKNRSPVITAVLATIVIVGAIWTLYLVRNYVGFGGYPTLQVKTWNPSIEHLNTSGAAQYTWTLDPQILIQNRGTAAASHVQVLWSISGGPLARQAQGLSDVGTILPGTNKTVAWTFHSGLTTAPFPTYIVTATIEYAQGPNIVATITLTPPAGCAQTPPSSLCA